MEIYHQPINPISFHNYWASIIKEQRGGILIASEGEKVTGLLGFVYQTNMFTDNLEAYVDFLYILPEYRGGRMMKELLSYLEGMGICRVELSLKDDEMRKGMERLGYTPSVVVYGKDL